MECPLSSCVCGVTSRVEAKHPHRIGPLQIVGMASDSSFQAILADREALSQ